MNLNLPESPEGLHIVSMCEFKGDLYVATQRGVYKKIGNEFVRLKFIERK